MAGKLPRKAKKILIVLIVVVLLFLLREPMAWYTSLAGWGLTNESNYPAAMFFLKTSIILNPDNGFPYINMGRIKALEHDLNGAIESYTIAIKMNPECADNYPGCTEAYKYRAVSYLDIGDKERAREDFAKAEELDRASRK